MSVREVLLWLLAVAVLVWGATVGCFWWVVLGIAFAAILDLTITKSDMKRQRKKELTARADQQHQWVLEGDARGMYGEGCSRAIAALNRVI